MVSRMIRRISLSPKGTVTSLPGKISGDVWLANRRGWMRITEACIAILIVLGMLLILTRSKPVEPAYDFARELSPILDEIAKTSAFREKIISGDAGIQAELDAFIKARLPQLGVKHLLLICTTTEQCTPASLPASDVYTSERLISSALTLADQDPKRLRFFVWRA